MRFLVVPAALLLLAAPVARPDIRGCLCELAKPETTAIRACSLCLEAEKHPAAEAVFLVHDVNPSKPNRWLALPRAPYDGISPLSRMPAAERLALWSAAVAKAQELWGDSWGIAMNGDISRTQCHMHVHIGKLLAGQEPAQREAVDEDDDKRRAPGVRILSLGEIPAIANGGGLWFHPDGGGFHLHVGEQTTETVLQK